MLIKQENFWVRGALGGLVREPRRTALPRGSQSRVLRGWDSFPGGLWPSHADPDKSGSILVVHTLSSQDGSQQGGSWEVGRTSGISF